MYTVIVDDDVEFVHDLSELLLSEGIDAASYSSISAAKAGLASREDPLVLILDHDFGDPGAGRGYDLCAWLRQTHPCGLLLPIIYLTGREQPAGFLASQRDNPHLHPSCYLSKGELARDTTLLLRVLRRYADLFVGVQDVSQEQSARQALLTLQRSEGEDET